MTKRRILAAVDGSDYATKVLDKAIEMSRLLGAEIVLVHCHKRFPRILGQPHRNHIISEIRDHTEEIVRPYITRLEASGVSFVERFLEGPAGTAIPDVASHEQCEMIVMGSRGLSNIEGILIGSVTHKVLHLASCTVMVVK